MQRRNDKNLKEDVTRETQLLVREFSYGRKQQVLGRTNLLLSVGRSGKLLLAFVSTAKSWYRVQSRPMAILLCSFQDFYVF
jgi:hypothetical protein